jgi:prepilin-type N-terminal cleavage/methylation domain-containing protein
MRMRNNGFTLIELMVVILLLGLFLGMTSQMFISMLNDYKQGAKEAESNIKGIIGLELIKRDIESAGYGLPWAIPQGTTYQEASDPTASTFNDAPAQPPRAILSGDNMPAASGRITGSDYLVIKSVSMATNAACVVWHELYSAKTDTDKRVPLRDSGNLSSTDRVMILLPGSPDNFSAGKDRMLLAPTGLGLATQVQFADAANYADDEADAVIYGVDSDTSLRMPFNRADYYINTSVERPSTCAPGTGVLVKSIINQSNGGLFTLPLLDCVADMQVVAWLDVDQDGVGETPSDGLLLATAQNIRNNLKEVRVYILVQEGQKDSNFIFSSSTVRVGEEGPPATGRVFNLTGIADWQHYRWKLYTMIIQTSNVR